MNPRSSWFTFLWVVGAAQAPLAPLTAQQGAIAGRVTDAETGAPLQGAAVEVLGQESVQGTDADGRFRVSLAAGTYTLIVSFITCGGIHLLMKITRTRSRHGFRGTWASSCYASGISIVGVVPVVGDALAIVWGAVLFAFGLRVVQGLSRLRAALFAAILPFLQLLSLLSTVDW